MFPLYLSLHYCFPKVTFEEMTCVFINMRAHVCLCVCTDLCVCVGLCVVYVGFIVTVLFLGLEARNFSIEITN